MSAAIFFVITVNLALGLAAGAVMYRADFCVAGILRDFFLFRKTVMLRVMLLLIVGSMFFFDVVRQLGLLPLYPFPLLGSPSGTNLAGGVIFGIGMVTAGGCVVGTLYKMGAGSLLSGAAFIGMIAGSGIYAEIYPWWISITQTLTFFDGYITIPQVIGCSPSLIVMPTVLLSAFFFYRWQRQRIWQLSSSVEGYLQPWRAALYLALLGTVSYLVIGMPFGITTAYAKMAAFLTKIVAPAHVSNLVFYANVPLDYSAPLSNVRLVGGAGPVIDAIVYIQFSLIAGIVFGAMATALRLGEFRVYWRLPMRQYVSAFLGGVGLALGSRMTPGCNVWHLFGGIPVLNMQSFLFLAGIIPGSYIGTRILVHYVLSSQPAVSS